MTTLGKVVEPATLQEAHDIIWALREIIITERRERARRIAQLHLDLAVAGERLARLKAAAQDADRMGHTIDVASFLRAFDAKDAGQA